MRDDYGRKWKRQDYWMAATVILLIVCGIIAVPLLMIGTVAVTVYVTGLDWYAIYWPVWALFMVLLLAWTIWVTVRKPKPYVNNRDDPCCCTGLNWGRLR